jgi:hypothetical protein
MIVGGYFGSLLGADFVLARCAIVANYGIYQ